MCAVVHLACILAVDRLDFAAGSRCIATLFAVVDSLARLLCSTVIEVLLFPVTRHAAGRPCPSHLHYSLCIYLCLLPSSQPAGLLQQLDPHAAWRMHGSAPCFGGPRTRQPMRSGCRLWAPCFMMLRSPALKSSSEADRDSCSILCPRCLVPPASTHAHPQSCVPLVHVPPARSTHAWQHACPLSHAEQT